MSRRCYFADGPPSGIADVTEDWGATRFATMWQEAHARYKRHDDGTGRCKVCGIAIDFDGWITEQDAREADEAFTEETA